MRKYENDKRNNRGITLIALIITVIVMLILAAIGLNLVVGDNGIFQKSKIAVERMKEETAREEINIAWTAIGMEYSKDLLSNLDIKKEDYYTKDNMNEELKGKGEITDFEYVEDGITTLTYVKPNKEKMQEKYYMEIASNGDVKIIKKVPIEEGTIEFSEVEWKDKKANIEMSTTSGHKIQYQIGSKDGEWIAGNNVNGLNLNDVIFARLYEGENSGKIFEKRILDEEKPNEAIINFSTTNTNTLSTIKATVEQKDEQSGVKIEECKWEYNKISDEIGTNPNDYTGGTFLSENQELDLKGTTEGEYYLHVLTIDNAGNARETISKVSVNVEFAKLPGNPNPSTGIFTENSTADGGKESAFNPVVPKGFKPIDEDEAIWGSTDGYKYGLIIQDGEGNQFVWVPVDGSVVSLGRQSFYSTALNVAWQERTTPYGDETIAKNINAFRNSVATHGGYYLARYEASYGTDGKPNSKVSTGTPSNTKGVAPTKEGQLWNNVRQDTAANACRNMYNSSYGVTSDLVNSYAWDTAIVYIQKYSGATNYSVQKSINATLANTGTIGDQRCHIHDMASNCQEWTTESAEIKGSPCVYRGGSFGKDYNDTRIRRNYGPQIMYVDLAFRAVLYL